MQANIFIRPSPRSIAIWPSQISHKEPSSLLIIKLRDMYGSEGAKCSVEMISEDLWNPEGYFRLDIGAVYGCIGLISAYNDILLGFVTKHQVLNEIQTGETIHRVCDVGFLSLANGRYDDIFGNDYYSSEQENVGADQPYQELRKYLKNGTFYFSPSFDLTKTTQSRYEKPNPEKPFDKSFLWNSNMLNPFLVFRKHLSLDEQTLFDNAKFITPLIQGYVGVEHCTLGSETATVAIISKLSSYRAGTRFNSRGIDDDGHVANFVETEFIMKFRNQYLAYVEVRGSVPVFWEQTGLSHKVNVQRSAASTQPAVDKHFSMLLNRYGHVNILNLLSQKEGERLLSEAFNYHVKALNKPDYVQMTSFDFHAICKGGNFENASYILTMIQEDLEKFGYFLLDLRSDQMLYRQSGIFRTNCLDCLDRTNVIQTIVLQEILKLHLSQFEKFQPYWMDAIFSKVSFLWAENGDCLSKMYAGTGALKSSYTRSGKLTFSGLVNDMSKSMNRMYINNFQDKGKQEIIDLLLGKSQYQKQIILQDEVHELISKDLEQRAKEYASKYRIRIHIGTYNVNGRVPSGESLSSFLRISPDDEPDIIALGIQEIVELTPTQIMSADMEKRLIWQREVQAHLGKVYTTSRYVLLTSEQLVGAAMLIFVRQDNISKIRNIQVSTKKTGLKGMAGNKGGIGIRFDFDDTSICLVTAHLAAGSSNFEERNNDYRTITGGIRFTKGRSIDDHDYIIWFGDFNYRINMEYDDVMDCIYSQQLSELLIHDQLNQQIQEGRAFQGFQEGIITFNPTYKYDNGTDTYDTSEKQRRPAWTDRILYRGKEISLLKYTNSSVIRVSDHKPVMGLFELEIAKVDHKVREKIRHELYSLKKKEFELVPPSTDVMIRSNQDDRRYKEEPLLNIANEDFPESIGLRDLAKARSYDTRTHLKERSDYAHLLDSDVVTEKTSLLENPNHSDLRATSSEASILDRETLLGKPQLIEVSQDELETSWIPLKPKSLTSSGYLSPVNIAKSKSDSQLLGQVVNPYKPTSTNEIKKYNQQNSALSSRDTSGLEKLSSVTVKKSVSTSPKADHSTLPKPLVPERKFQSPSVFAEAKLMRPLVPERRTKPVFPIKDGGAQRPPLPSRGMSASSSDCVPEPVIPSRDNVSQKPSTPPKSSIDSSETITLGNIPSLPQRGEKSESVLRENESTIVTTKESADPNSTIDIESDEDTSIHSKDSSHNTETFEVSKWKPLAPERSSNPSSVLDQKNLKKPLPPTRKPRSPLIQGARIEHKDLDGAGSASLNTTNLRRARTLHDSNVNSLSQKFNALSVSAIQETSSSQKRLPPPVPARNSGSGLSRARTISAGDNNTSEVTDFIPKELNLFSNDVKSNSQSEEKIRSTDGITPECGKGKSTSNIQDSEELPVPSGSSTMQRITKEEGDKVEDTKDHIESSPESNHLTKPMGIKERMAYLPIHKNQDLVRSPASTRKLTKDHSEIEKNDNVDDNLDIKKLDDKPLKSSESTDAQHVAHNPKVTTSSVTALREKMKNQLVLEPTPRSLAKKKSPVDLVDQLNTPSKSSVKERLAQFSNIHSDNQENPKPTIPMRKNLRVINTPQKSNLSEIQPKQEEESKEKETSTSESSSTMGKSNSSHVISGSMKRVDGTSAPFTASKVKSCISQLPMAHNELPQSPSKPSRVKSASDAQNTSSSTKFGINRAESDDSKLSPRLKKAYSDSLANDVKTTTSVRGLRDKLGSIPVGPAVPKKPSSSHPIVSKPIPNTKQDKQTGQSNPNDTLKERTAPIPAASLDMHKKRPHPRKTQQKRSVAKASGSSKSSSSKSVELHEDTFEEKVVNTVEDRVQDQPSKATTPKQEQTTSAAASEATPSKKTVVTTTSSKELHEKIPTLEERRAKIMLSSKEAPLRMKKSPSPITSTRNSLDKVPIDAPHSKQDRSQSNDKLSNNPMGIQERKAELHAQNDENSTKSIRSSEIKSIISSKSNDDSSVSDKHTKSKIQEEINAEVKLPSLKARKSIFEDKKASALPKVVNRTGKSPRTPHKEETIRSTERKDTRVKTPASTLKANSSNANLVDEKSDHSVRPTQDSKVESMNDLTTEKPPLNLQARKDRLISANSSIPEEKSNSARKVSSTPNTDQTDNINVPSNAESPSDTSSGDDTEIHGIQARKALLFGEKASTS